MAANKAKMSRRNLAGLASFVTIAMSYVILGRT